VSRERVAHAAVRFRGRIFLGASHKVAVFVAARALRLEPSTVWTGMVAGFTTTTGRLVSRAEAWKIAKQAGQLRWDRPQPGVTPELHSEDFARHGYAFLYLYRRGDGLSRNQGTAVAHVMDEALAKGGQPARNQVQVRRLRAEDLDDALAGLAALRARSEVDPHRVGIVGHSFGGSLSVLLADRDTTLRAAVIFSGSGLSWDCSPELRGLLRAAAARSPVPMFFLHARNDFATAPGESLAALRERLGRPGRVEIYPAIGRTAADGHDFIHSGIASWEREVFAFLDARMKP
jgi:dienelactone hydrolase